jgi:iron complex transport system substrate-binding protein
MAPSITETVFSLNLSGNVVGVDSYSDYPPLLMQLENSSTIVTVGGVSTPDVEMIAALKPNVVFLDQGLQDGFVSSLTSLGLNVEV